MLERPDQVVLVVVVSSLSLSVSVGSGCVREREKESAPMLREGRRARERESLWIGQVINHRLWQPDLSTV